MRSSVDEVLYVSVLYVALAQLNATFLTLAGGGPTSPPSKRVSLVCKSWRIATTGTKVRKITKQDR